MKVLFIIAAAIIIGIILLFVYAIFKVSAEADDEWNTEFCEICSYKGEIEWLN